MQYIFFITWSILGIVVYATNDWLYQHDLVLTISWIVYLFGLFIVPMIIADEMKHKKS